MVFALGATLIGKEDAGVAANSVEFVPVVPIAVMTSGAVPVLVTVTVAGALGVLTGCAENVILLLSKLAIGVPTPVPVNVTE